MAIKVDLAVHVVDQARAFVNKVPMGMLDM